MVKYDDHQMHTKQFDRQRREFLLMTADRLIARCDQLMDLLTSMPHAKKTNQDHGIRDKRFVFTAVVIAILAAVTAGAVYSIYVNSELNKMEGNANTLTAATALGLRLTRKNEEQLDELAHIVSMALAAAEQWNHFDQTQIDRQALQIAEKQVTTFEQSLAAAASNKLHPSALAHVDLERTATDLWGKAKRLSLTPMVQFYSDWLQQETSFVRTAHGFNLFVHIPLMGVGTGMNIFQHVRLPVQINGDYVLTVESPIEYLAINHDGSLFRGISQTEFTDCRRAGKFFACDRGNLVRKAPKDHVDTSTFTHDPELCLWALHKARYSLAAQVCDFFVATRKSMVVQLTPTNFAVYNQNPHQGYVHCRNSSRLFTRTFAAHSNTIVELPQGCTAQTDTHIFTTSDIAFNTDAEQWTVTYDWPHEINQLTKGLNMQTFHDLRQRVDHILANRSKIHLNEAIRAVDAIMAESNAATGTVSWFHIAPGGGAVLFSILALLLSLFNAWKMCNHNCNSNIPALPIIMPIVPAGPFSKIMC